MVRAELLFLVAAVLALSAWIAGAPPSALAGAASPEWTECGQWCRRTPPRESLFETGSLGVPEEP